MRQDVRDCLGCATVFVVAILIAFVVLLELAYIGECQERHPGASWRTCLTTR